LSAYLSLLWHLATYSQLVNSQLDVPNYIVSGIATAWVSSQHMPASIHSRLSHFCCWMLPPVSLQRIQVDPLTCPRSYVHVHW